jgi:hypothetical protein
MLINVNGYADSPGTFGHACWNLAVPLAATRTAAMPVLAGHIPPRQHRPPAFTSSARGTAQLADQQALRLFDWAAVGERCVDLVSFATALTLGLLLATLNAERVRLGRGCRCITVT